MGRLLLFAAIGALLIGLWARSALVEKKKAQQQKTGKKEQEDEPSELNKHPERLDQMLDPTDDA
jgi:hypothetical protein